MKWAYQLNSKTRRLRVMFGFLLILVAGIVYLLCSRQIDNPLPDQQVKSYFRETTCQLISKKLSDDRLIVKRYRADFLVSYKVAHEYYRRWVHGNGLDDSYFTDASDQEDILSRYHVGGLYPCYYNPADAGSVVLVLRQHWGSVFPLAILSFVLLLALYGFLVNLLIILGVNVKKHKGK